VRDSRKAERYGYQRPGTRLFAPAKEQRDPRGVSRLRPHGDRSGRHGAPERADHYFCAGGLRPASCYRPPLFLRNPQRQDYGCHPGSWGVDFVEPIKQLAARAPARVIAKHTFDAFFETELRGFLRFKQIDTLYVAGVETNVCVLFTACSALSNGFNTCILAECVTTSRMEVHAQALQIIEIAQGRLMSKQDFLTLLEGADTGGTR
jgi:nicotinamidase-related amidase